jgi:hypothetical protein
MASVTTAAFAAQAAAKAKSEADQILMSFPDAATLGMIASNMNMCALKIDQHLYLQPTDPARVELALTRDLLWKRAVEVRAEAMGLLGAQAQQAMKDLKIVTQEVNDAIAEINKIKLIVNIGTALLVMAGAIGTGQYSAIFKSLENIRKLIKDLPTPAPSPPPTA